MCILGNSQGPAVGEQQSPQYMRAGEEMLGGKGYREWGDRVRGENRGGRGDPPKFKEI